MSDTSTHTYTHTHTHFLSVLPSSPQYPMLTLGILVRGGMDEAGHMFHEWQLFFVAAKGLNNPGI